MWINRETTDELSPFYIGVYQENTPARGMTTLFINGVQSIDEVATRLYQGEQMCEHIYLGLDDSFDPGNWQAGNHTQSDKWDNFIKSVLSLGFLTTLCFDVKHTEWVLEGCYAENNNFIPMVSVKIPYLEQLRYNAVVRIDDKGYNTSNPGVWCHSLHELQDRTKFTTWNAHREVRKI